MKSPCLLTFYFIFQLTITSGQDNEQRQKTFDSIFFQTYVNTAATDPDRALQIADSLYKTSIDDISRIRSLMLMSNMHYRKSNRDSTVYYAVLADKIASESRNYLWQARINGVLSTQHRKNGLYRQGRQFLEKGLHASKKIKDTLVSNQFQGHVYQEMGFYARAEDSVHRAVAHFKESIDYFLKTPDKPNRMVFLAQSHERLGKLYNELDQVDSSLYHYQKALELENLASDNPTIIKGFIYNGLGLLALKREDHQAARDYLFQALEVADASDLDDLKVDVYPALSRYYRATGDIDQVVLYNDKFTQVRNSMIQSQQDYASDVLAQTDQELQQARQTKAVVRSLIIVLLLGSLTGLGIFFWRKQPLAAATAPVTSPDHTKVSKPGTSYNTDASKKLMPEEVEKRILSELGKLEQQGVFLEKEVHIKVISGSITTRCTSLYSLITTREEA